MISLSAPTYDVAGTVLLPWARVSNPYDTQRRGSVTATLDGGVSVYDTGYSDADQILRATVKHPSRALLVALRYLIAYYAQLILCCETGCYSAVASFSASGDTLNLQLRVITRLDT
jgi:hypothetical protein